MPKSYRGGAWEPLPAAGLTSPTSGTHQQWNLMDVSKHEQTEACNRFVCFQLRFKYFNRTTKL